MQVLSMYYELTKMHKMQELSMVLTVFAYWTQNVADDDTFKYVIMKIFTLCYQATTHTSLCI